MVRALVADADKDSPTQPVVWSHGRLENRCGSEVVLARVKRLTSVDARLHFGRGMRHATILHIDHRAIVGFNEVTRIEFDDAIGPQMRPITAAVRHDLAL